MVKVVWTEFKKIQSPSSTPTNYFGLKFELERILNRSIDLLENKATKTHSLERRSTDQKFSSMDNEVRTWLKDNEQAIAEINSFIPEGNNFKDIQKDLKTKRAAERNI